MRHRARCQVNRTRAERPGTQLTGPGTHQKVTDRDGPEARQPDSDRRAPPRSAESAEPRSTVRRTPTRTVRGGSDSLLSNQVQ
eukprot:747103-Hanusia_phi.AAC.1